MVSGIDGGFPLVGLQIPCYVVLDLKIRTNGRVEEIGFFIAMGLKPIAIWDVV